MIGIESGVTPHGGGAAARPPRDAVADRAPVAVGAAIGRVADWRGRCGRDGAAGRGGGSTRDRCRVEPAPCADAGLPIGALHAVEFRDGKAGHVPLERVRRRRRRLLARRVGAGPAPRPAFPRSTPACSNRRSSRAGCRCRSRRTSTGWRRREPRAVRGRRPRADRGAHRLSGRREVSPKASGCASVNGMPAARLRSDTGRRAGARHVAARRRRHVGARGVHRVADHAAGGPGGHAVSRSRWVPGAEGWLGVVPRGGDGTDVRWFRAGSLPGHPRARRVGGRRPRARSSLRLPLRRARGRAAVRPRRNRSSGRRGSD